MTEQDVTQPLAQIAQEQTQQQTQQQVQQPPMQQGLQLEESQTQVVDQSDNVVDNPYQSIIDQQQAQIAALMAQNDALNQQVTRMVQGGAQFSQQPQQVGQNWSYTPQSPNTAQQLAQGSLSDNQDWSLESLGKEIGKPRKEV